MIQINGEIVEAQGITLLTYLQNNGYKIPQIVIERNGEILSSEDYEHTTIADGDIIEIISFMGGGQS